MRPKLLLASLSLALLAAACGGTSSVSVPADVPASLDPTTFAAQVASTDLYVSVPQRVQIGVFQQTASEGVQLLTSGTIQVALSPFQGGTGTPVSGSASYVPAPGTQGDATGTAALTAPDVARGVYELAGVTFDAAGVWQADVSFRVNGAPLSLSTQFQVTATPALPAPGQKALRTENLTMNTKGADPQAIDSRGQGGAEVPDPELHATTIAAALAAHRPILVLFSTPVYCMSQFCGPTTDALQQLAASGPKDAAYIHIEIYADYQASKVNRAAADWLLRNGNLTEPWLFLIDRHGTIVDRWSPLFDVHEVQGELEAAAAG
jgi:hypothetical protein